MHTDDIGTNLFDGGAPFYSVYETADGKYVSLAPIEPHFYAQLLEHLGLAGEDLPDQYDRSQWPALKERFAAAVRTKTRAEWEAQLAGTDVCFAPVYRFGEAHEHPHNGRGASSYPTPDGGRQVAPAPRFSRTEATPGDLVRVPRGRHRHRPRRVRTSRPTTSPGCASRARSAERTRSVAAEVRRRASP